MDVMKAGSGYTVQRRVAGAHDIRLDGMVDLLQRARGASVFDVGCNRGMVGYEFALNGASTVHGCDIYERGVMTAREVFADLRAVESQFEVVDLTGGVKALSPFKGRRYDITVCLATYHKLKRAMPADDLAALMLHLAMQTNRYFAWRGTSHQEDENLAEMGALDLIFGKAGLDRIHTSYMSEELGVAAVWSRRSC